MPDSPRLRMVLGVAAAILLLAGLVVVVTAGDDVDRRIATGSTTTTTTTIGDPAVDAGSAAEGGEAEPGSGSAAPTSAPAGGGGSAPGGGTDTTTAPQARAASADPGQPRPTKTGHYTFEVTVDGETSDASYTVEASAAGPAGETRQAHTMKGKRGDLRNDLMWNADGVHLEKTSGSSGEGFGGDCDWNPDVLAVKVPLAVGSGWVSESSCSGESPYGPYSLKARFEWTVAGTARVDVGGQGIDVWIIDGTHHFDITAQYQGQQFTATQDQTSKRWFSPRHGLTVREESQSTTNAPTGQRRTTTTLQLKSLAPQ